MQNSNKMNLYSLYTKKINHYLKKNNDLFFLNNKINVNYFIHEIFNKNVLFNKLLSFFLKKGKKFKYLGILYKVIKYIKLYIRQQPVVFFNKSLTLESLFFDITELHLKKKLVYIPKVIKLSKQFNYSFSLIIKHMWSFINLKLKNEYSFSFKKRSFKLLSIIERVALFFLTMSLSSRSQLLLKNYYLKLNKIALTQKYKLFKKNKYKYVKRRKQKKKITQTRQKNSIMNKKPDLWIKHHVRIAQLRLEIFNLHKLSSKLKTSNNENMLYNHKFWFIRQNIMLNRSKKQSKWSI